ncbi:NAD(P)H-hydrate epimerase [Mycetocola miduiensis]|uniref:NAD(P)H-hydrate epimerase n=1 Tax=Mycetocola miduiensis TaxID=995034 RepID=A0A1I5C9N0_9MICO|nr:NAD(P)H-hydrate epimerase [Mycetocola miduiensis]SFN83522.1 yjeF N-terminal region [Mycetocola miduiensis]
MEAYTAAQIRAAEEPLLAAGVPLMARAAAALAREIRLLLAPDAPGEILLLVGPGNNGGDALFAGAELAALGNTVTVVPTSDRMHEGGRVAAIDAGVRMLPADTDTDAVASLGRGSDVVVDGILGTGTGATPALRGRAREIVAAILPVLAEEHPPVVVAVDLPSGVHPDDGSVPDPTVLPADVTVTFGACKTGLLIAPAVDYVGRLVVVDIGLGPELDRVASGG